jgi:hypothetical protein
MTGKPLIIVLREESPITHPVRNVRCLVLGRLQGMSRSNVYIGVP